MTSGSSTASPRRRYAPRMPPEQRREHLLDCALRIVVRDGYDQVSVGAISKEAGVTRPVVYSAYDGLEALMLALLERTRNRAYEQALGVLNSGSGSEDLEEWLTASVARFLDCVQADPDVWRPVLGLVHGTPAVVRRRIEETRDLVRARIERGLSIALETRGADGLDVGVLAHVLVVTIEEFARLTLERPAEYGKERLVTALSGLLKA
ncbi:TetR/AcrR family transcriptional regulator [Streptomyces sp. HNM0575]|uniref:TetR/AcrR family transcriptional regulator n=1 Tax=Streptomyces sp. HNM0575 TaxID=2716338 RepID=UPI00145CC18C|nr:TetR/AcrR family transcriptional regulator [Streptomyces sp. HNM0575]NLU72655.1 TetR/AcrR family transcriptional regulator [Streptomyces sp. HNM0575]